jgi:type IV secretion system protein VirD4
MRKKASKSVVVWLLLILSAGIGFAQNNNTQPSNTERTSDEIMRQIDAQIREQDQRIQQQRQQSQQPYYLPPPSQLPQFESEPPQTSFDEKQIQRELKRQQQAAKLQSAEQKKQQAEFEAAQKKQLDEMQAKAKEENRKLEEAQKAQAAAEEKTRQNTIIAGIATGLFLIGWTIFLGIWAWRQGEDVAKNAVKTIGMSIILLVILLTIGKIAAQSASLFTEQVAEPESSLFLIPNAGAFAFLSMTLGVIALFAITISLIVATTVFIKSQEENRQRIFWVIGILIMAFVFAAFSVFTYPILASVILFLSAITAAAMLVFNAGKKQNDREARHGTARFLETNEIKEAFPISEKRGGKTQLRPGAFYLAPTDDGDVITLNWNETRRHGVILGGTGTGKTRGYIMPTCAYSRGTSLVVTDPKSELWNMTSGYREKAVRFAPTDPDQSAAFNWIPLCASARMAELCARALIESGNTGKTDQFWLDAESAYLAGIFAHVATLEAPTPLTAYRFFTRQNPDETIQQLRRSPSDVAREQAIIFEQTDSRIKGSIVPAVAAKMQFLRDDATARFTSASLEAPNFLPLRYEPIAIYYCLREQDISRLRPLTSLFFTVLLEQLAAVEADAKANVPILAMLDEFANVGKIPDFEVMITLARGRGIALWLALQAKSQLEQLYGNANARTILGNLNSKIALDSLDIESAKYISEALGDKTEAYTRRSFNLGASIGFSTTPMEHKRPLMTPDEITRIGAGEALVRTTNKYPMRLQKTFYDDAPKKATQSGLGEAIFTAFAEQQKHAGNGKPNLMYEMD